MATIISAASGNWSAGATWVGGVVPTSVDDVFIVSNHIIQADVDINVISITRNSGNGYINVLTSRTINCITNITCGSANLPLGLITINANSPNVVTINAANIIKSCTFTAAYTIQVNGTAQVNINANVSLVGGNDGITIIIPGTNANVNIVGTITNSKNSNNAFPTININGSGAVVNITGTISPSLISPSVTNSSTSTLIVNGIINGNTNQPAISSTNSIISGVLNNTNGRLAVSGVMRVNSNIATQWLFQTENALVTKTLYDVQSLPTIPTTNNVRDGIVYANGALTGTSVMPSASTVSLGVVYDNGTVGTAQNTADLFLDALTASTSPLAVRLSNVVTTDILGAQIAAYSP